MAKKTKNPLYVVTQKGSVVEEAAGFIDLLIKKFNLAPVINFFNWLFKALLEQVEDYPTFIAVKNFIDRVMKRFRLFLAYDLI